MYICIFINMYDYIYIYIYNIYIHTYKHMYRHTHMYIYVCIYICVWGGGCSYVYIYCLNNTYSLHKLSTRAILSARITFRRRVLRL